MCAPAPPSPQNTIAQQTASNRETAITQAGLNMVNQQDAAGNTLQYEQIGTWPDGTPRYQAKQALGTAGQQLQTANQGTAQNLANLANQQSGRLSGLLNAPIDFSAQKDYLEGLTSGALDRTWDRDAQRFETDLVNRGLRPGTTEYREQLRDFSDRKSSAYNASNVSNYNTALQSQLALRAAPLNEILALSGQSQVQSPQFSSTPQTGVAGTDVAGIINQGYNQQNQQYGQQQSMLGGLFSAGANLLPLAFSDRRLKEDIRRIGTADNGLPIYAYRMLDDIKTQIGFMADEVAELHPEAVFLDPSGYLKVDYAEAVK